MAKPTPGRLRDLKVARYLLGTKHTAPHCNISTYVDSDFDGCRQTRRRKTRMIQMVGEHAVKHTSNLQGATGLNVSECEYHALSHGAAHGLGLLAYMADLGFDMSLQIFSGSLAAKAFASRRGLGRQRHVQTRYLWLTSHSTEGWNYTEPSRHSHKGSHQRTLERQRKKIGLKHVEAHRSQKELRLGSLANPVSEKKPTQLCATCGEPADVENEYR